MVKTKIIATSGPSIRTLSKLRATLKAGVDVVRINFAHGSYPEYRKTIQSIRRIDEEIDAPVAILADLAGPKIRCGNLGAQGVELKNRKEVILSTSGSALKDGKIPVSYRRFALDVKRGERIYLADGEMALVVKKIKDKDVICRIERGGFLFSHKGINLPDTDVSIPALTTKDKKDIEFAVKNGVDWLGLSFVRSAEDLIDAKKYISRLTSTPPPLLAKIEKRQAVDNLEEVIAAADGVMVARGDLGVEIDLEKVPVVQKRIIRMCNKMGKPVVTATQMLESMIYHYRPTRAEVTDIANAIFDGTDAVMLSGETAIGRFPVESVNVMNRVAESTERDINYEELFRSKWHLTEKSIPEAISHAACQITMDLGLDAIICCSQFGSTARMVARYRPPCPVIAVSPLQSTVNQLCMSWGVIPLKMEGISGRGKTTDVERLVNAAIKTSLKAGLVKKGWRVVITAGLPLNEPGTTNLIRVVDV